MSKPVIFITSATSRNGIDTAKLLLSTGKCIVRLGARDPTKLAELVAQGAEAVVQDSSLERAFQICTGVDSLYLILPALAGGKETIMFTNYLQAAKETGVKHVVYLSAASAALASTSTTKQANSHYEHEQELLNNGISFTILRPSYFYENTLVYHADSIKLTGEFRTSAGDGVWTSVAISDIAAVAAEVLTNPLEHSCKICTLTTEAFSDDQLAEKIGKVIGKKVTHVNLTPEEHAEYLKKTFKGRCTPYKVPVDSYAAALVRLDKNKRENLLSVVSPDVEVVLGRKGVSMDEFLAQRADAFVQHC